MVIVLYCEHRFKILNTWVALAVVLQLDWGNVKLWGLQHQCSTYAYATAAHKQYWSWKAKIYTSRSTNIYRNVHTDGAGSFSFLFVRSWNLILWKLLGRNKIRVFMRLGLIGLERKKNRQQSHFGLPVSTSATSALFSYPLKTSENRVLTHNVPVFCLREEGSWSLKTGWKSKSVARFNHKIHNFLLLCPHFWFFLVVSPGFGEKGGFPEICPLDTGSTFVHQNKT